MRAVLRLTTGAEIDFGGRQQWIGWPISSITFSLLCHLYSDSVEQGSIFLFAEYLISTSEDRSRQAAFRDPADVGYLAYPYAPRVQCHAFQDAVCTTNPISP